MMNSENLSEHIRIHRVGSITLGIMLVVFGVLFLLQLLIPQLSYEFIFHLWPVILISMGLEVLASGRWKTTEMKYDNGAVCLLILMSFFAMCMAGMDMLMRAGCINYL